MLPRSKTCFWIPDSRYFTNQSAKYCRYEMIKQNGYKQIDMTIVNVAWQLQFEFLTSDFSHTRELHLVSETELLQAVSANER